jgi:hypothetical protein
VHRPDDGGRPLHPLQPVPERTSYPGDRTVQRESLDERFPDYYVRLERMEEQAARERRSSDAAPI